MTEIEDRVRAAWERAGAERRVMIADPADDSPLFGAPVAGAGEIGAAVKAARAAAPDWARTPAADRGAALARAAERSLRGRASWPG
jgi:acyl-CoA reductase-like NAD-dependent aldehyde dehydrogenase